ncbi:unnamed protein product [Vicia faba]|uniref:Uncharacterized protein n=1 Tax=Vicia faba TaxID=3906 RepID=A0AAV0Z994_VICFA|nr:unnamed protein product [Vicia faba]
MSSGTVNFPAILVTTRESTFPYEHSIGRLRVRRGSLRCLHTRLPFSESSAGPPTTSLRPEGFIAQKRRDAGSRRGKPNECLCQSSTGIDRRLRERELHAFYRIFRSVRATREYGDGSFHQVLDINTPGSRPFGHIVIIRRKEYPKALALCIKLIRIELWEEKRKREKPHPSLSRGFAACQAGSSLWLRLFCQASFGKYIDPTQITFTKKKLLAIFIYAIHFASLDSISSQRIDAEISLIKEEKINLIESGFQVIVEISLCFLV